MAEGLRLMVEGAKTKRVLRAWLKEQPTVVHVQFDIDASSKISPTRDRKSIQKNTAFKKFEDVHTQMTIGARPRSQL